MIVLSCKSVCNTINLSKKKVFLGWHSVCSSIIKVKYSISRILHKCIVGYYHSMQIFLPIHWPRAHHVTCK